MNELCPTCQRYLSDCWPLAKRKEAAEKLERQLRIGIFGGGIIYQAFGIEKTLEEKLAPFVTGPVAEEVIKIIRDHDKEGR